MVNILSTHISYYDKIHNFNFDPAKLVASWEMPFNWNRPGEIQKDGPDSHHSCKHQFHIGRHYSEFIT
jgi:hypothetical protein